MQTSKTVVPHHVLKQKIGLTKDNEQKFAPQHGHKQWQGYFGRTFDIYTRLWKFQQQHRAVLDRYLFQYMPVIVPEYQKISCCTNEDAYCKSPFWSGNGMSAMNKNIIDRWKCQNHSFLKLLQRCLRTLDSIEMFQKWAGVF